MRIPAGIMIITTTAVAEFAREVRRDLALAPRQIQSKYLYDALGSSLFEAICRLPWYRITRAEHRLLLAHAAVERLGPFIGSTAAVDTGACL